MQFPKKNAYSNVFRKNVVDFKEENDSMLQVTQFFLKISSFKNKYLYFCFVECANSVRLIILCKLRIWIKSFEAV